MMMRQMVICTIDHTDGDLHNDQQMVICLMIKQIMICIMIKHTLIFKFYIWEHLELKSELKLSNMYAYITYFTTYISVQLWECLMSDHALGNLF